MQSLTMNGAEAARLIGVNEKTLTRWLNDRSIRRSLELNFRKHNRRWKLTANDVQALRCLAKTRIEKWLFVGKAERARKLYRLGTLNPQKSNFVLQKN